MSWNEPGGDKKDPWSGRNEQKGPPDLDEAIRSLQEKLSGLFGGGKRGGGDSSDGGPSGSSIGFGLGILIVGALVLWAISGLYIIDAGNRGVVTRFGAYTETTQPGLNWHYPAPIEQVEVVNIAEQRFIEVGYRSGGSQQTLGSVPREALMLTRDENIVDVRLAVQYQIKDAKNYAFNVLNQKATLKQVTESVERGVIGHNTMDFALTEGRSEIVAEIKVEIQEVMDNYKSGILITSVNLQDAQPPEPVQGAFEDAIKAREDKERFINEAQAYSNGVIPVARGEAARKIQQAEGYKARVIARSEGKASRFSQLLVAYKKAPEITRKRIYIEAMEDVLSNTTTVMIDVKGSNNLLYLPLDKLGSKASASKPKTNVVHSSSKSVHTSSSTQTTRNSSRSRDVRRR